MSRICQICGKGRQTGHNVSHSKRRTAHTWKPNLAKISITINNHKKSVLACAQCRKTISKPKPTKKKKD